MGITFKSTLKRLFPFYETSFRELFDGSKFSFFPYYFLGGHIVLIRQMIFSSYNMGFYWACIKVSKSQKHFLQKLQKTNKTFYKILPLLHRAEFLLLFCLFYVQWIFKKKCFWDLLTFIHGIYRSPIKIFHTIFKSQLHILDGKNLFSKTSTWIRIKKSKESSDL